ncbi:MAG TPA: TRAP transporter substrate-binding protein [Stellaceae bacterium]|nr:TRAP transporter substrate-binding protein [Stellaceae bacterium]
MRKFIAGASICLLLLLPAQGGAQDIQQRTIRFGHLNNTDHPISLGVKKFAEIVAAKSGGKLAVQEFPASQLGNEMQQQSALRGGVQEMTAPAPTSLAGIVREFGILDFPFIVGNSREADALTDGPVGKLLLAKLPEKDLVGLAFWDLGFRNVTNSRHPIVRLEDFRGIKLRVIPNPVFIETFKAFGANPVPMPFAELYPALETRAVDGQENPYSVILSNKFFEVQKFLSATNHVYTANIVLVGKKFWDRLSPKEQQILQDAAIEARDYERQVSRSIAQKALGELTARGMQLNELAPAELERMRQMVKPIHDKFAAEYDPAVVGAFRAELERIRRRD